MKMEFKKYGSIENAYRSATVNKIQESIDLGYCKDDFVVLEKIHGTNFSVYVDETGEITCAKRTGFLNEDSNFYNFQYVVDKYKANFIALQKLAGKPVRILGELFGGGYDHPDVEKDNSIKKIQKGIQYSPNVEFMAFDVSVFTEVDEGKFIWKLLDTDYYIEYLKWSKLPFIPILFRGTFEEALKYPNAFKSTIPGNLGLPEIESDNICEGTVIKPFEVSRFGNGERIILKNKNDNFTEIAHGKKDNKNREPKIPASLSEEGKAIFEIMLNHLTENRLRAVLSKEEQNWTNKDFGKIIGLFTADAFEEFNRDYKEQFDALDVKDRVTAKKKFGKEASVIIRKNFLNILDNEF